MAQSSDPHQHPRPTPPAEPPVTAVERNIPRTRYIFVLAIVSTYAAAVVMLVFGFVETFKVVFELLSFQGHIDMNTARLHFIEVIDIFLLATILYVISSGFYQLFGAPLPNLPQWLRVTSVDDLEHKLIGVLITVLGVLGLSRVASWDGQSDLLPFGATVALLIASLAFFVTRSKH